MERGRGPHQPYRNGGRRGGYTDGEGGDESGRPPRRAYECHSGTGRGYGMKHEGAGHGNWGTVSDEALAQETLEVVNTEGTPVVAEDENKLEEVPQSEVEKGKEGEPIEEEEPGDKGSDREKKKENAKRDERAKKSVSINEFLKPEEGKRYYNPSGRGRDRGRGHGDRGGFRSGYSPHEPAAPALAIHDQDQFPSLGGK